MSEKFSLVSTADPHADANPGECRAFMHLEKNGLGQYELHFRFASASTYFFNMATGGGGGGGGSGDMVAATYDPQGIGGDAFDRGNHTGLQAISTVTGLQAALDLKAALADPDFSGTPSGPTAAPGNNSTQLATTAFVQSELASVIGAAPGALNTLDELAAALGDDANFAATMTTSLAGKQPLDATLTAFSGLAGGADKLAYFTGVDTLAQAEFTAFGRSLAGAADQAGGRTALGLGALATLGSVNNANWSGTDLSIANGGTGASTAQAAINALLGAGTDGQVATLVAGNWQAADAAGGGGSSPWTDADPVLLTTTTRDVAIGAAQINGAKLSVDGDDDQVQLAIQGHSAQTANLFETEDSAGTVLAHIEPDGDIVTRVGASSGTQPIKFGASGYGMGDTWGGRVNYSYSNGAGIAWAWDNLSMHFTTTYKVGWGAIGGSEDAFFYRTEAGGIGVWGSSGNDGVLYCYNDNSDIGAGVPTNHERLRVGYNGTDSIFEIKPQFAGVGLARGLRLASEDGAVYVDISDSGIQFNGGGTNGQVWTTDGTHGSWQDAAGGGGGFPADGSEVFTGDLHINDGTNDKYLYVYAGESDAGISPTNYNRLAIYNNGAGQDWVIEPQYAGSGSSSWDLMLRYSTSVYVHLDHLGVKLKGDVVADNGSIRMGPSAASPYLKYNGSTVGGSVLRWGSTNASGSFTGFECWSDGGANNSTWTTYYNTTNSRWEWTSNGRGSQAAEGWMIGESGDELSFFGAAPVGQQNGTGEATGFVAGSGTGVNDDSTFTGNVGSTAYRINDLVKALKNLGFLAS